MDNVDHDLEALLRDANSALRSVEKRVESLETELAAVNRKLDDLRTHVVAVRRRTVSGYLRDKLSPRLFIYEQYPPRALRVDQKAHSGLSNTARGSIAIVTPSHNGAPFIDDTIQSVVTQGHRNCRYHVQDNLSDDGTLDVLKRTGDRVSWVSERDDGQSDAINRGFQHVDGDIMA